MAKTEPPQRLPALLRHVRDPVLLLDSAGRILDAAGANPALERFVGHSLLEFTAADETRVKAALENARSSGMAQTLELLCRCAATQDRWFLATFTPLRRDDGQGGNILVTTVDVHAQHERVVGLERAAQLMREIEEVASVGVWTWDPKDPHAWWSPQLYAIYGLDPKTHTPTYEDYLTRVHPDDRERVKRATESVFRDFRSYSHDERIFRPNGSMRYLHTWAHAVLDAAGKLERLVGVCQDVTERKVSEERYHTVLESVPDAFLVVDAQGHITEANRSVQALFGYEPAEIIGQPVELLVPLSLRDRHVAHREQYSRAPRQRAMGANKELMAQRKDGTLFPVEVGLSPVATPDGVIVIAAVRDMTERRRAQAQREELERLRVMNEFKAQFINMAAHELNTPLTPIKLQSHLLKMGAEGPLTPGQEKSVRILERNIDRIVLLVQNMLDVGRIQSGRIQLRKSAVDVNTVVAETVEAFSGVAEQAGVAVETALAPEARIEADLTRLGQVLFNLLSNAIKFTPSGGRVRINSHADEREVVVTVEDTGVGLRPAQIERLFQPFTQVHEAAQTSARPGTGLGLYISRQLVELHGGTLTVASPGADQGSVFRVALPRQAPNPEPPGHARPLAAAADQGTAVASR